MGNFIAGLDPSEIVLAVSATGVAAYSGFYLYRDYHKKGVVPIKNLQRGQHVSIEGKIRPLAMGKGSLFPIYKKKNVYTLVETDTPKEKGMLPSSLQSNDELRRVLKEFKVEVKEEQEKWVST